MKESEEKKLKKTITTAIVVGLVLSLSLTLQFLLGTSKGLKIMPSNLAIFILITVNLLLISIFVLLIGRIIVKLWMEKKKGLPGSNFSMKLVSSVLLATTVPALLLFFISAGFVNKSVEIWFSERRQQSLKYAVDVAKEFANLMENNAKLLATSIVSDLKHEGLIPLKNDKDSYWKVKWILQKNQKLFGAKFVEIYREDGKRYASTSVKKRKLHKEIDITSLVKNSIKEKSNIGFFHKRYYCYLYPYPDGKFVIFLAFKLPKKISEAISGIRKTYQEYSYLKLLKSSVKQTYIAILLMISALIIFSSSWYALQIAKSVTVPIETLINATKEVAKGNLDISIETRAKDELGMLIQHFNRMIRDLAAKQRELEERKAFIETVVENITTGVISIDRNGNISTINSAAKKILGIEENPVGEKYWHVFPKNLYGPIYHAIKETLSISSGTGKRTEVTMHIKGELKHLLVSASPLKDHEGSWVGVVIVIEDITELVKIQRAQAWEEVARRMAHEIKNPLTPISLSAQRIKRKLKKRHLTEEEVESLNRSADAIIRSTETISNMVNEFSRFAKLPDVELKPDDITEIIKEAVDMYRDNRTVDFELHFSENLPKKMLIDREQMKRVFINLIDNALHAMNNSGKITIKASYNPETRKVRIEVADTGCGIPDKDKDRLFQPYFSKRKGGTGLGLAIVNRIITEHDGTIRAADNHPQGAVFIIELPYREAA